MFLWVRKLFCCRGFCLRCFCLRSFDSGSIVFGSRLARTASASCLLCSFVFEHSFVVVNELDKACFCVITEAVAGFEDTCVSTGTIGDFLRNLLEEDSNSLFVLEIAEDKTTVGSRVVLGAVDKRFGINSQGFSFCQSSEDSLVKDKRDGHVGKERIAVSLFAT